MKKEEILNASRKEHRNKDLAEMEVAYQAGCHASRVGALVCWFKSVYKVSGLCRYPLDETSGSGHSFQQL